MDKFKIATQMLIVTLQQNRLKISHKYSLEEYNKKLAETVGEMFKIIYQSVNTCDENESDESDQKLTPEELTQIGARLHRC